MTGLDFKSPATCGVLLSNKRDKHDRCNSRSHKIPQGLNGFDLRTGLHTRYVARVLSVILCVPLHRHGDRGAAHQEIAASRTCMWSDFS